MSTVELFGARWRKSSRSNAGGNGNCVEVAFLDTRWRKSSRSNDGGNGNCVEVAFAGPVIAVRDSKNPAGTPLAFAAPRWGAFLTAAKHGHFDQP
jgi:hypothetical protein